MKREENLITTEEEEGIRIDSLLAARYQEFSRTYFQYLLSEGAVLLNGKQIKKREKVRSNDEIEVCFLLTPEISLSAENIPLEILYEDSHLLAINKPAGMVVHPAPGNPSGTFVNALLYHCKELPDSSDHLRPGIVHRLDKETTGVLLAAKTKEAHQQLVSLFAQRKMKKRYLAICLGNPGEQTVSAPIGRHPLRRKEMAVCTEGGKEAISHIKTLAHSNGLSLVEIRPQTGRTHQIRVHLKEIGCPILGDSVYGSSSANKKWSIQRQLLHAYAIAFPHPLYKEQFLELSAPIPQDFQLFSSLVQPIFFPSSSP